MPDFKLIKVLGSPEHPRSSLNADSGIRDRSCVTVLTVLLCVSCPNKFPRLGEAGVGELKQGTCIS